MTSDAGTQDAPIVDGADEENTHGGDGKQDTRTTDSSQLPDGSGSDGSGAGDGADTASGGGADDE